MSDLPVVAVCAMPPHQWEEIPGRIFEHDKKERITKLIGQSYTLFTNKYSSKREVALTNEHLHIGKLSINWKDIVSVRLEEGKKCHPSSTKKGKVSDCYYIALQVNCESVDEVVDGINGTEHILVYLISQIGDYYRKPREGTDHWGNRTVTRYSFEDELLITNNELKDLYKLIKDKLLIDDSGRFILIDLIERPGQLKIEGWKNSNSQSIDAEIEGDYNESGASKGIHVGAFSASRSVSEGELNAELKGNISNDSYVSEVDYVEISNNGILVLSDPVLEFEHYQIDQVMKRKDGFSLDVNGTVYSITSWDLQDSSILNDAINQMQENIKSRKQDDNVRQDNDEITNRLRNLKSLYDDGILSDTEYDSKKAKLLEKL